MHKMDFFLIRDNFIFRFQREDILATLLSQIEGSGSGVKRVPSYVAPDLAAQIRRHVTNSIRLRKGSFPCCFVTDMATFALPAEVIITIFRNPSTIKKQNNAIDICLLSRSNRKRE